MNTSALRAHAHAADVGDAMERGARAAEAIFRSAAQRCVASLLSVTKAGLLEQQPQPARVRARRF